MYLQSAIAIPRKSIIATSEALERLIKDQSVIAVIDTQSMIDLALACGEMRHYANMAREAGVTVSGE